MFSAEKLFCRKFFRSKMFSAETILGREKKFRPKSAEKRIRPKKIWVLKIFLTKQFSGLNIFVKKCRPKNFSTHLFCRSEHFVGREERKNLQRRPQAGQIFSIIQFFFFRALGLHLLPTCKKVFDIQTEVPKKDLAK